MKKGKKSIIIIGAIILAVVVLFTCISIWLNAVWFSKLGYIQVFTTILGSKVGLWCGLFVVFFLFSGINIRAAFRKGSIQELKMQRDGGTV